MAPHKHEGVLAISTQGQIQHRAKIGHGGPLLTKTSPSERKSTATNRMHSNDLKNVG